MKVYVLERMWDREPGNVIGVYTSAAKARIFAEAAQLLADENSIFVVTEIEVDRKADLNATPVDLDLGSAPG